MAHAIKNAIIMPDVPPAIAPMTTNNAVIPAIKIVVFKYPISILIYREGDKKMTEKKDISRNREMAEKAKKEIKDVEAEKGGRIDGKDPTRYGDWEKGGKCVDF